MKQSTIKNNKERRHNNWGFVFDFYWSDESSESVRFDTFKNKKEFFPEIEKIIDEDSKLNFRLFEKFGVQHPVSQLWLESETDIKASVYLCFGGHYRQAIAILRNWLELTLLAIYFSKCPYEYEKWKKGVKKSPTGRILIGKVFKNEMKKITTKKKIKKKCKKIYGKLSVFIHSRSIDKYKLQEGRDNVPRYLEESFNLWFKLFKETSKINRDLLKAFFIKT